MQLYNEVHKFLLGGRSFVLIEEQTNVQKRNGRTKH